MVVLGLCTLVSGRREQFAIADAKAPLQKSQRTPKQDASLCGSGMPRRVQALGQRRYLRADGVMRLIWVVCYEAKGYISTRIDLDDVATDGSRWRVDRCPTVDASVDCRALYYLEVVAVDMERMAPCVEIVDYYLYCVAITEYLCVGGITIDKWVGGVFTHA